MGPSTRRCPPAHAGDNMRWWLAFLVLVPLLFILVPGNRPAGRECVVVNALGYDGHSGRVIPLEFCAVPGDGTVYLDSRSVYGRDFQVAVATAREVFRRRNGGQGRDVLVRVHGAPEYFDGRSVALAVYAGIFSVLFGYDVSDYAFTGDLSPDGTVLPVSYIDEKASAFEGNVVVPLGSCREGLICVSDVSELEDIIASKRV